jgi:hypothetical protein
MPQAASFRLAFGIVPLGFCWLQFCKCFLPMTALLGKRCSKCGVIKSVDQYRRDKAKKDGLYSQCNECEKKYAQANPVLVQTAHMIKRARNSAKENEIAFNIDLDYIRSIVPSHCPIFKTKLEWSTCRGNGSIPLPNSPSIDRIDPSRGYVKGNVWIISHKANRIKNNASHEELKLVTEAVGRAIVNSLDW